MGLESRICPQSLTRLLEELLGVAQAHPNPSLQEQEEKRCCDGHLGERRGTVHGAASLWDFLLWPLSYLVWIYIRFRSVSL